MAERLTDDTMPLPDAQTERAARAFLRHIAGRYPVQDTFLFGSRARGTYAADSDADLAVVLHGDTGERGRIAGEMAYYAMFDAARAALLAAGDAVEGAASKTHNGLIAAFGRELVLTGAFDAALGRAFNRAHEIRLLADYTAEPPPLEDATWAVTQAERFVAAVRTRLDAGDQDRDRS